METSGKDYPASRCLPPSCRTTLLAGGGERPWTVNVGATLLPDTELIEFVCNENEKDQPHLVGK
jgi:hypothetical protein